MSRMRRTFLAVLTVLFLPAAASAVTVEDVIHLSKSGVSDDVILALIDRDRTIFTLDAGQLVALKREGVSEAVVKAMLKSGRDEGEEASRRQSEEAAAELATAISIAPSVIVIGHGPTRPNTAHPYGFNVTPHAYGFNTTPYPLSAALVPGGFYLPPRTWSGHQSLCHPQPVSRAVGFPVAGCPQPVRRKHGKLAR